MDMD
jgi:hypothetical protein